MNKKGFTLIELLVVIAIIGILSSVVLSSLNSARGKGSDTAIKSGLVNLRSQAEMIFDDLGCFATQLTSCSRIVPAVFGKAACAVGNSAAGNPIFGDTRFYTGITGAINANKAGHIACASSEGGLRWAVAMQLKADPNQVFCVDSSSGVTKTTTITSGVNATSILTVMGADGGTTGATCIQ